MSKRSALIQPSSEGKVLRRLREQSNFSMREAGEKIGVTSSTISHIENGRMNAPKGDRLARYLSVYGITEKAFKERVRNLRETVDPKEELIETIRRMSQKDFELVRGIVKGVLDQ
jgi:transcriptional regulator with XRE-family HTH domain